MLNLLDCHLKVSHFIHLNICQGFPTCGGGGQNMSKNGFIKYLFPTTFFQTCFHLVLTQFLAQMGYLGETYRLLCEIFGKWDLKSGLNTEIGLFRDIEYSVSRQLIELFQSR